MSPAQWVIGRRRDEEDSRPLSGNRDFRRVFRAAVASKLGIQVSYVAIPLLAVLTLNASAGEVGILGALSTVAFLVIGLPAGAWVDRLPKRAVQVTADVVRALMLISVPAAWLLGALTITQLYLVALVNGVATVFFDVAAQSYLPHIVGRDDLVAANTRLGSIDAVNMIAGRSVGGLLVQVLSAPFAVVINAATFCWSALCLARVRAVEPAPGRRRVPLWADVLEGLRFVVRHPLLRPIAITGALNNLSVQLCTVMLPVLFTGVLGLSPGYLGVFLATGGVGVFIGTTLAGRLGRRVGYGRAMWVVGLATIPVKLFIPLLNEGVWVPLAALGWLLTTVQVGVNNVLQVSLRQRVTPDGMLGRMNATMRFLMFGSLTLGSVLAGVIGEFVGARVALSIGVAGLVLVWLPPYMSALRNLRDLPVAPVSEPKL